MISSLQVKMNITKQIREVFKAKTMGDFLITSSGTVINGLLGLLFYIVVARILGPSSYGILAVSIASMVILSDIADLGIDTGILRFVGKYTGSENTLRYLKLGLEIKFIVWLLMLILGWILAPLITSLIFLKPELTNAFRFALIGSGGASLFSLTVHALQAYQRFWAWSLVNISMNSLRLLAIIALVAFGFLNFQTVLFMYILVPFLGFFATLFLLPNFFAVSQERSVGKELFHYSKWVAIVGILTALSSRLDTFLTTRLLTTTDVGIYSAALQLTAVLPQIMFALSTVVAPKLATLNSDKKAVVYLTKLQFLTSGLFLGGLLIIPMAGLLIPFFYGDAYRASLTPFVILFVAQLVFLLSLPTHQAVFYYFSKPRLFTITALGTLLITGLLGWVLILRFGVIGAAITILISNIFNFIIPGIWVIFQFQRRRKNG